MFVFVSVVLCVYLYSCVRVSVRVWYMYIFNLQ